MGKITEDIGKLIRELRQAMGMSQMAVAARLGVSYQQVQKYEKGRTKISVPRLKKIAAVFGMPVQVFFGEEAEAKHPQFSNFTEDEKTMVMLYRRLQTKKSRTVMMDTLGRLVRMSEGSPRAQRG